MAIATLDQYLAATKQRINFVRTASVTSVAGLPYSVNHANGYPGNATLAGTGVNGALITDATAGYPPITFSTGTGYLSKVEFANSVLSRISIYDLIWVGGTYNWNVSAQAISHSAISGRVPSYTGGANWGYEVEAFVQIVTTHTSAATWSCAIQYTDQDGNTGNTSASTQTGAAANLIAGRLLPIPLAAGDKGIQAITQVTATTGSASAGTFNLILARPLWTSGRVPVANGADIHDMLKTGMPIVYNDSALLVVVHADSTATGLVELYYEIASA